MILIIRNKRKGSKLKSNTPLLFGLPAEAKQHLKNIPRIALKHFKENKAIAKDWETLMFRIRVAYESALLYYIEQTQLEIKEVCDVVEQSFHKQTNQDHWVLTEYEMQKIELGLDAMDEIQDNLTRKELLEPYRKTQAFMQRFKK